MRNEDLDEFDLNMTDDNKKDFLEIIGFRSFVSEKQALSLTILFLLTLSVLTVIASNYYKSKYIQRPKIKIFKRIRVPK